MTDEQIRRGRLVIDSDNVGDPIGPFDDIWRKGVTEVAIADGQLWISHGHRDVAIPIAGGTAEWALSAAVAALELDQTKEGEPVDDDWSWIEIYPGAGSAS